MNKTTHLLGGVVAAQLMNKYAGMPLDLGHTLAVVYAATIPDFDTNNSAANKPSDLLPFGLGDLAIFRPVDAGAGLLGKVLSTALKHRGQKVSKIPSPFSRHVKSPSVLCLMTAQ